MDLFFEKIVSKKKSVIDIIIAVIILVSAIILVLVMAILLRGFGLAIGIGIIYGAYYLLSSLNIEFEYTMTNGDLDIDKIISQRKRKKLFSGNSRDFEIIAKLSSGKYGSQYQAIMNKIDATHSMKSENVYFIVARNNNLKCILFFEPDDRMILSFRQYNPSRFFQ
jgi:cephalosporin hydroxylase